MTGWFKIVRLGLLVLAFSIGGMVTVSMQGCDDNGGAEEVGEELDEAAEEVKEGVEEAADKVEEGVDEATDEVK